MEPRDDVSRPELRDRTLSAPFFRGREIAGQGVHDRSVPEKKGCPPGAAGGGHSTQVGTAPEGAPVVLPEDPPETLRADAAPLTPPTGPEPPPRPATPDPAPPTDLVAELVPATAEVVPDTGGADAVGLG